MKRLSTSSAILKYIKEKHKLMNTHLAVVLDFSEAAVSRVLSDSYNPKNLEGILSTFNFAKFPSPDAFNNFLLENEEADLSAVDFTSCLYAREYYYDLTDYTHLVDAYFGLDNYKIANHLYDVYATSDSNLIFSDFERIAESFDVEDININRVRYELLCALSETDTLKSIKNAGLYIGNDERNGVNIVTAVNLPHAIETEDEELDAQAIEDEQLER